MVSRRVMQSILGAMWFFDGLLQLKPQMFTSQFVTDVILPTSQDQPSWIASLVNWGSQLVIGHVAVWNVLFAVIQICLGIALMLNFKTRGTIIVSLLWSAIVWIFGEGFGQVLTGQALLLTGAPGAALIYALMGISIWPSNRGDAKEWSNRGVRFAQVSLAVIWGAGFILHLQQKYLTPGGFSQSISLSWLSNTIGNAGVMTSVLLGLIELVLALMLIFKLRLRITIWISVVLSLLFWWIGQSFGQVTDPLSTDPNAGLLFALYSVCAYPRLWNSRRSRRTVAIGR